MTVTIGIDPHKSSHTAVAIDTNENVIDSDRVPPKPTGCTTGPTNSSNEIGRSNLLEGSAISSLNNSSQQANTSWMSRPQWHHESECSALADHKRAIPTMPARSRSPRFAQMI
jgi:hypothetical protein